MAWWVVPEEPAIAHNFSWAKVSLVLLGGVCTSVAELNWFAVLNYGGLANFAGS
jgi:hypothetical protein